MTSTQKVVIITAASRGIGAAVLKHHLCSIALLNSVVISTALVLKNPAKSAAARGRSSLQYSSRAGGGEPLS